MLTIVSWNKKHNHIYIDNAEDLHPDDYDENAYLNVEYGYLTANASYKVYTVNAVYFNALRANIKEFHKAGRSLKAMWIHHSSGVVFEMDIDEDGRIDFWPDGNPFDYEGKFLRRLL